MWLALLGVLIALIAVKLTRISLFWKSRKIPYEPYWRYLYRILWDMHRRPIPEVMCEVGERYGPTYGSYRGLKPALALTEVEDVKEVFIKQFENFFNRSMEFTTGEPLWDNMLIQLPYDQWKALRTIMGFTFTTSKMRGMIKKLDVISQRLMNKVDTMTNKETSLSTLLKLYAIDSNGAIALGLDVNSLENPDSDFVRCTSDILKPGPTAFLFVVAPQIVRYMPFIHFPPKKLVKFLTELSEQVLKSKRKNLDEVVKEGTADILDLHLIAQRDDPSSILTDEILASQAFLFTISSGNTGVVLDLTIYFLTVSPDAQQRAFEEIRSVLKDRHTVDYEDLQKMKFVEACLLESLRLVPLAGFIDRICRSKTVVAGEEIPEGMVVEVNFAHMQRNPEYFPEPDKYKPERFLKDHDGPPSELGAYMIFGQGPKNCVGKRLALMNMQVVLAHLLLRFKLEPTENTPKMPLKLKPGMQSEDVTADPIVLRFVPRTAEASG